MAAVTEPTEASEAFACFGTTCVVLVSGRGPAGTPHEAAAAIRRRLELWHRKFSRFEPDSELSRLNRDPRWTVPVSSMMLRFAEAVGAVGSLTAGLVDGTLGHQIERAGYTGDLESPPPALRESMALAPPRRPGGPSPRASWREVSVDPTAGAVTRPPGVQLDSGGIVKGLFADTLAPLLAGHPSFAVDCGGDIRLGGAARAARDVEVTSPFDGSILTVFALSEGAVATSGVGKRSWTGSSGRPAHHLLDPATGEPAFTGIVQVTALAPTGVIAEAMSKAAILAGPGEAERWLAHGGVIVLDDGSHRTIPPPARS